MRLRCGQEGRHSQLGVLNMGAPPLEPHFFCSMIPPSTSEAEAEMETDPDWLGAWGPSTAADVDVEVDPETSSPLPPPPVVLLMSDANVDAVAGSYDPT